MRTHFVVQLGNITPTGPRNGKFFIPGTLFKRLKAAWNEPIVRGRRNNLALDAPLSKALPLIARRICIAREKDFGLRATNAIPRQRRGHSNRVAHRGKQERRDFLCGAGVSKRAGLPLFDELTEQVYDRIGERRADVAAERRAFDRAEFDRALRSLEKRTLLPRAPSRVRTAVSELLQPRQGVELTDHLALVQLSRDAEGRPKLLTTNFDTLFERAAQTGGFNAVPSHAGKAIPKPGGPNDHGVLHLHGRLADATLGLVETDLVLTSADFGDAYLRDGWASQYVEDRMRLNTLVLVGYAAEDPAMRLLLETLDADRDRFRDLKDIYAIERRSDDSASIWDAKGIKPIEFESYDNMYETLREWARYAMNPREYRAARVNAIFAGPVEAGE